MWKLMSLIMTPFSPSDIYQRFWGIHNLHFQSRRPEDRGDIFLRNVGNHLEDYALSQPKIRLSEISGFHCGKYSYEDESSGM
jgi:hypothetical protein